MRTGAAFKNPYFPKAPLVAQIPQPSFPYFLDEAAAGMLRGFAQGRFANRPNMLKKKKEIFLKKIYT
jgi:hypothetical protein